MFAKLKMFLISDRLSWLLLGAASILILIGFAGSRPCAADSEASSQAGSEAGSEAGLFGRHRRRWYRQPNNQQSAPNNQVLQHEKQVRMLQQRSEQRRIQRPDKDFVHEYGGSGSKHRQALQRQFQTRTPAQN